jgi:hypothetical protein
MKFGQAETPCKTGILLMSRDRLEGLPASLINKANSPASIEQVRRKNPDMAVDQKSL